MALGNARIVTVVIVGKFTKKPATHNKNATALPYLVNKHRYHIKNESVLAVQLLVECKQCSSESAGHKSAAYGFDTVQTPRESVALIDHSRSLGRVPEALSAGTC